MADYAEPQTVPDIPGGGGTQKRTLNLFGAEGNFVDLFLQGTTQTSVSTASQSCKSFLKTMVTNLILLNLNSFTLVSEVQSVGEED